MARIFPFRPWRYSESAGPIDHLVTQPYDKISPAMQARYLSLSPYNMVRLILGERYASDDDEKNVYTRAAAYLRDWTETGVLRQDDAPGFYVYFQQFTVPDSGETLTRKGFIGLGAVEEYEAKVVHRHEQTLSGPKKDRRELLRYTHAHFGQIFMLYPDHEGAIDAILDEAAAARPADISLVDDYGVLNQLWRVSDPQAIERVQSLMIDKKLLIADGHHRYETALAFHHENRDVAGSDKVMMTFVNMYNPGLRILASHRVLHNLPQFDAAAMVKKLGETFTVRPLADWSEVHAAWQEPHADRIRFGLVAQGLGTAYLLETVRRSSLDVQVLHADILRDVLGISDEAVREEKYLHYVRGANAAVEMVGRGEAQAAFLMEPPPVDQVADISFAGGVMPQKSTDFFPKMLSGLTIYRL